MSEEAIVTEPEPAESAPRSLFKYATWVHVGPGAEQCSEVDENEGTNQCPDSGHFHAWCRLPNQFQQREIRERAMAAKGRKTRQLRDPEADANVILETELEDLLSDPEGVEKMADELIGYDWSADYVTAVRQTRELDDPADEDEEPAKLYEHIDEDRARFARLQAQSEDERPEDEFGELSRHIKAYEAAVQDHYEAISNPKRESYLAMQEDDLADILRRKRVQFIGGQEYMHHFSIHQWLSCTYKQPKGELFFRDLAHLEGSDNDVLVALADTFADLERTAQEAQGN